MKISALASMWMCIAFGLVAGGYTVVGFTSLPSMTDAAERDAAVGYIWFWGFLTAVAVVFGVLSWMMKEGRLGGDPGQM